MAHSQLPMKESIPVVMDFDAAMDAVEQQTPVLPPSVEEPAPADKPRQKRTVGRPKKTSTAPAKKVRKKSEQDMPKKVVGIYYTDEDHINLKIAAMRFGNSLSDFVASVSTDAMYYSYQCCEPSCGTDFVLRSKLDGEPAVASCCPVCGSKQIVSLKVL